MVIGKVILFVLLVIAIGVGIKFVTGVDVSQSTNGGSFGVRIEPATTTPSTNYSTVNVNNSDYWDGLDTPADITYDEISGGDVNDLGYYGYFNGLGGVVGGLSMDGDPWWLSGTDFQIDQELEVDGDTYLSDTFPRTTLTYSLGSGALRWLNLFVQNVNAEEIDAFNLHLSENLTVDGYINGVNISNLDEDFVQYEGATANVNITNYNVTADDFFIPAMDGGGSYSSLNDAWNLFNSAGRISGGALTNPSGTNVVVEAGEGIFRIADDDVSQVKFGNWSASDPIAIATNTIKYIGIEWNGGSPQVISYDDDGEFDLDTEFPLGTVINQADTIYILNNPWWVGDGLTNVIERFQAQGWLVRDENMGGLVIGYTGTRALTMTSGTVWGRLVEFPIPDFDSSGTDTFNMYYQDGAGNFLEQSDLSQWNNTAWDDGGVLTTINNNQYSVLWVWLNVGADEPAVIYPQQTYSNVASAEAEEVPNTFPSYWSKGGILLGRIIVKQGVDAPIEVQSAFSQVFNPAQATDHGNLGGLGDDDHLQYLRTDGTRLLTGNWNYGSYNINGSGNFSTTGDITGNELFVHDITINNSSPLIKFYNTTTHTYDIGTTPGGTFAILQIDGGALIVKHDTTDGLQFTEINKGIKMISDGNIDFTDENLVTTGNVNGTKLITLNQICNATSCFTLAELNTTGSSGGGNLSWNQSLANELYAGIEWDYNQTESGDSRFVNVAGDTMTGDLIVIGEVNSTKVNADSLNFNDSTQGIQFDGTREITIVPHASGDNFFMGDMPNLNLAGITGYGNFFLAPAEFQAYRMTSAYGNIGIGPSALRDVKEGNNNLAIGGGAFQYLDSGSNNLGIGLFAGLTSVGFNGTSNIFIGNQAGRYIVHPASYSTTIGTNAGQYQSSEYTYNVLLGDSAGRYIGSAVRNTIVGTLAGNTGNSGSKITGNYNTLLGYESDIATQSTTYGIGIGAFSEPNSYELAISPNVAVMKSSINQINITDHPILEIVNNSGYAYVKAGDYLTGTKTIDAEISYLDKFNKIDFADKTTHPSKITYQVEDRSRSVTEEVCEEHSFTNEDGKEHYETVCVNETTFPYTKEDTALMSEDRIVSLEGAIIELKEENELLKNCISISKDFTEMKHCIDG